jgi:hypothetical protein
MILLKNYADNKATVMPNHENVNIRNTGKSKAQHRKYKRFMLGGAVMRTIDQMYSLWLYLWAVYEQ